MSKFLDLDSVSTIRDLVHKDIKSATDKIDSTKQNKIEATAADVGKMVAVDAEGNLSLVPAPGGGTKLYRHYIGMGSGRPEYNVDLISTIKTPFTFTSFFTETAWNSIYVNQVLKGSDINKVISKTEIKAENDKVYLTYYVFRFGFGYKAIMYYKYDLSDGSLNVETVIDGLGTALTYWTDTVTEL